MRFLWVVAVLAACNEVYGLDETKVKDIDGDVDEDGKLDSVDNCPSKANPDQEDVDGDGKGDACALICMPGAGTRTNRDYDRDRVDDGCDPCPRSPQEDSQGHVLDEDGDGVYDACDNCPGTPNPDQANTDSNPADELGDACDPGSSTFGSRLLFDPFWRRQSFWATAWDINDGVVTSNVSGSEMALIGVELAFQNWSIETGIELPAVSKAKVGLELQNDTGTRGCSLERGPTGWQVVAHNNALSAPVDIPGAAGLVRLRATLQAASGSPRLLCDAAGARATLMILGDTNSSKIRLIADVPTKFTYVDLTN